MRFLSTAVFLTASVLLAEQFSPNDVKIVGDVEFGKTTPSLECPAGEGYCAVLFNAQSADKFTIQVKGSGPKTFLALADGSLTELARGTDQLSFALPKFTDDLQTFYIVFRDAGKKAGSFTVTLTKTGAAAK